MKKRSVKKLINILEFMKDNLMSSAWNFFGGLGFMLSLFLLLETYPELMNHWLFPFLLKLFGFWIGFGLFLNFALLCLRVILKNKKNFEK